MIELALVQPPLALAEVEGIAYFFGDGSLFCAPGTSGYILDPDSPDDDVRAPTVGGVQRPERRARPRPARGPHDARGVRRVAQGRGRSEASVRVARVPSLSGPAI